MDSIAVGGWSRVKFANCTVELWEVNDDEIGAEQVAAD